MSKINCSINSIQPAIFAPQVEFKRTKHWITVNVVGGSLMHLSTQPAQLFFRNVFYIQKLIQKIINETVYYKRKKRECITNQSLTLQPILAYVRYKLFAAYMKTHWFYRTFAEKGAWVDLEFMPEKGNFGDVYCFSSLISLNTINVYCSSVKYPASIIYICHKCLMTTIKGSLQQMCLHYRYKDIGISYSPVLVSASAPTAACLSSPRTNKMSTI